MREGRDTAEDSTDERRDCMLLECMKMRGGSSICSCWLGIV
jgi:hypothetical protein